MTTWAAQELATLDLGDKRLNGRAVAIVDALARRSEASLPQALESWAASKAAYRFFANERAEAEAIRRAHYERSGERIAAELRDPTSEGSPAGKGWVLVFQDTSELNYAQHPATTGLGTLDHPETQGLKVHSSLAASEQGVPLGLVDQLVWTRAASERGKAQRRATRSTREKESQRWLDALQAVQARIDGPLLMISDRESDIFDLLAAPRRAEVDLLIRAAQNRRVEHPAGKLWQAARMAPLLGEMRVEVPRADERPARTAQLSLQVLDTEIRPPRERSDLSAPLSLRAVLAEEMHPPEDDAAIRWLLVTSLPVNSLADAQRCVRAYALRWLIERYHYVLKSGCKVEDVQLEAAARLERALALYCLVAWRLLWLTYEARSHPETPCDEALSRDEWQALTCTVRQRPTPPDRPPSLRQAVHWIAQLGGFLGRERDGEPGVKTIWRGLRRLSDMAATYRLLSSTQNPRSSKDVGNA